MATILGLDLGKFKSLACLYDTETTATRFTALHTDRPVHWNDQDYTFALVALRKDAGRDGAPAA